MSITGARLVKIAKHSICISSNILLFDCFIISNKLKNDINFGTIPERTKYKRISLSIIKLYNNFNVLIITILDYYVQAIQIESSRDFFPSSRNTRLNAHNNVSFLQRFSIIQSTCDNDFNIR
ncbi:hypothetical protein DERP_009906 [Dermatophagoides pteronyssinus]|uniref:Uncharacterized protein n=1 Tax=Dermatophagoides pteronyssinus TaxID=6956 RepID=A0ABQ8J1X0_DERPT|nr:hypothetical protein DERP_009906 [Dermatophagoides pteronyssinus]